MGMGLTTSESTTSAAKPEVIATPRHQQLSQLLESKAGHEALWQRSKTTPRLAPVTIGAATLHGAQGETIPMNPHAEHPSSRHSLEVELETEARRELSVLDQVYQELVVEASLPLHVPDGGRKATAEAAAMAARQEELRRAAEERKRVRRCALRDQWLAHGVEDYGRCAPRRRAKPRAAPHLAAPADARSCRSTAAKPRGSHGTPSTRAPHSSAPRSALCVQSRRVRPP